MNRERNIQFTYGSIVQLKDLNQKYKDVYFFIDYVSATVLKLLSNEGLNRLELLFDEETGKCLDETIEEIQIVYQSNEGYAILHGYVPGTLLRISFQNEEKLKARVIALEEDMITLKNSENDIFFIDFHYSGIDEEYQIKEIEIEEYTDVEQRNNNEEKEEKEEEEFLDMYTFEQQIDDYINKRYTEKNRRSVNRDIKYYSQLMRKYTNLDENISLKQLPENEFLESFYRLNQNFMMPVSSYIYREIYYSKNSRLRSLIEDDNSNYSVSLYEEKKIQEDTQDENKDDFDMVLNKKAIFQKRQPFHKRIVLKKDSPLLCIRHQEDDFENFESVYVGLSKMKNRKKEDLARLRTTQYMRDFMEKDKKFVFNGTMIHSLHDMESHKQLQPSESILSKTIKNQMPHFSSFAKSNVRVIAQKNKNTFHSPASFFNKSGKVYYPLTSYHNSFEHYIQSMNIRLKDACMFLNINYGLSFYDFLKELSMMDIHEVNIKDIQWIQRIIKKSINSYKSSYSQNKNSVASLTYNKYEFKTMEKIFSLICNHYKEYKFENSYPSELMHQVMIDDGELLMYYLQKKNETLYIDDKELEAHIESLNLQLQENNSEKLEQLRSKPVKTYNSLQEMEDDKYKIILKDPDEKQGQNNVQYLYSYLVMQFQYTDSGEQFTEKLQELLREYDTEATFEENEDLQTKLFGHLKDHASTIFTNLVSKIIELRVRKGDKCIVKEHNSIYVFDGTFWIPFEKQKELNQKKKMLRIQNSTENFDTMKETIMNDFVLRMVDAIHNEGNIDLEKKAFMEPFKFVKRKTLISNDKVRKMKQYNQMKLEWIGEFSKIYEERKQSGFILSPYLSLLYVILSNENMKKKYILLESFTSLFCVEKNDPQWFHCILSNTKLVPKYLLKLSRSYLTKQAMSYQETMKKICLEEGTLSEHGDMWIHKESGYTIQKIEFDTNYGYDEGGFKIKMDSVPQEEEDDLEEGEIEEEEVVSINKEDEIQLKKEIVLTQMETQFGHLAMTFMSTIGISMSYDDSKKMIKEMYNIYRLAMGKKKQNEKSRDKLKVYIILGVLLTYVQTSNVYIKKSFPGCIVSFEGYPLNQDRDNDEGVTYFSCILEKIVKNMVQAPYSSFKSMTYTEISDQLKMVIESYILQNAYVLSMIQQKRADILKDGKKQKIEKVIENIQRFRPCLYPLKVDNQSQFDSDPFLSKKLENTYEHMIYKMYVGRFFNMKIEEMLFELVRKEKPIMINQQYQEPFLKNYCCNQTDFILNHLTKTSVEKDSLQQLLKKSKKNEQEYEYIETYFVKKPNLNIMKKTYESLPEDMTTMYEELTVYRFMIYYGHFDDDKPIAPFLRDIVREKPSSVFYDKNDDLYTKTKKLKENGFIYDNSLLINALHDKAIIDMKKIHKTPKKEDNNDISSTTDKRKQLLILIQNEEAKLEKSKDEKEKENIQVAIDKYRDDISDLLDFEKNSSHHYEDFFPYSWNTNRENMEAIRKETEILRDNYRKYVGTYLTSHRDEFERVEELLRSFDREENKVGINSFLQNILYTLLCVIPQIICVNKIQNTKVYVNKWNFALAHNKKLLDFHEKYYKSFDSLETTQRIRDYFETINARQYFLYKDDLKRNIASEFIYLRFLYYKTLSLYCYEDVGNMTSTELKLLRIINKSTIIHVDKMKLSYIINYGEIDKYRYRIKQSEKMDKTEKLRKMSKKQRNVEKEKMKLKLGDWSYGTNKRVFKYYKDLYEDEDKRADEVKDIMHKMYEKQSEEGNVVYKEAVNVDDDFIPEEQEGGLLLGENDDYYDEQGEELEIDDNY